MVTTGLPAPGFAAATGQVMRVRSRTESTSSATALRSGPVRFAGATTVACVRSAARTAQRQKKEGESFGHGC